MSDADKTAVAAHLYVTLRRTANRVIDVEWMSKNEEYAREILRLSRSLGAEDLSRYADRYEELMFGKTVAVAPQSAVVAPVVEKPASTEAPALPSMFDEAAASTASSDGSGEGSEGSNDRYIGHLR
ncbi:MAG: hypothetical protein ACAH12_04990 [Methylophilaceae bacterium]